MRCSGGNMTGKNGEQAREHEVLNEIVRRPETKAFLSNLATDPYPGDQALLRKIAVEETKKWGDMMEAAGIEKQ